MSRVEDRGGVVALLGAAGSLAAWIAFAPAALAQGAEAPKVLTDEAEMIRFAYQRLQFDLKRFAVVETRRDRVRGASKSAPAPVQASVHSVPVINLGPIQTGRVGDILDRPYREVVTVPTGKVPAAVCSGIPRHCRQCCDGFAPSRRRFKKSSQPNVEVFFRALTRR
jgi:hypothetical protein